MLVLRELSRKEFKNFKKEKENQISIVGDTLLRKYGEEKHKKYDFVEYENDEKHKKYLVKQDYWGFKYKYLDIGDDKFIVVKTRMPLLLLLIILLLGCYLFFRPEVQIPLDAGGEDIEGYKTPQAQTDSIKIPGLMSSYTLTEDNKELYLINPDGNTVYFKYSITEDDEQIYETDYIEPNKMERADLWGILDSGEHTLKVSISTIDIDTGESCNSAALETKVIIK